MKRVFVLLVAIATMFAQDAFAQDKSQKSDAERAEQKAKREQIMQTRLELLKTKLNLTPEQFAKFEPVYRKYRHEIGRVTSTNKEARTKKANTTNENALKIVSARLANQIFTATVKQRYLMIFAEVIEPLQIMELYRIEEKVSREAQKIIKSRSNTKATTTSPQE